MKRNPNTRLRWALVLIWAINPFILQAQTPPEPSMPEARIKISGLTVETATLAGTNAPWTRMVARLSNKSSWIDNVTFSLNVLYLLATEGDKAEKPKIQATNLIAAYSNVPPGDSEIIFYLSPLATRRFGKPKTVVITTILGADETDRFVWGEKPSIPPEEWRGRYPFFDNVLLPSRLTPWFNQDFIRMPDQIR